jgi:hypothetical protein
MISTEQEVVCDREQIAPKNMKNEWFIEVLASAHTHTAGNARYTDPGIS